MMNLQRVLVFTWFLLLSGIVAQIGGLGIIDTSGNDPILPITTCPKEYCMDKPECLINIRRLRACASSTSLITTASCGCSFKIDQGLPPTSCPKEYCMDKPECWINIPSSRPCVSLTRPITAASCRCSFSESEWPFRGGK
ncbi:uncharacterized protein LOC128162806 [Crassostrea angulata]|uniref:uncharacterized protein LOC128162806 n=1 Tax=Magallana angulata TaxID=2784310 RepID=UPI0022B167A0|nr:uncharacterized protein LOC128162806 [Crassostrea angulata]